MTYRIAWQLTSYSGRLLDSGDIGEVYSDYRLAAAALRELLRPYPEVVQGEHAMSWKARRSRDADLELWVRIIDLGAEDHTGAESMLIVRQAQTSPGIERGGL
ncbi:hypothetical protein [Microvirga makkahensis]|uniref:Uncharacterized protein n=1 Tax=Microvirga makkahensis TaxID=1128670 RepID=A0A7X3MW04_9HYPH|nr:hypothetical protein [Microvirga makkahensis]MXQ14262.1 hypothetical protein [Microvirga makkahensis]